MKKKTVWEKVKIRFQDNTITLEKGLTEAQIRKKVIALFPGADRASVIHNKDGSIDFVRLSGTKG